MRHLDEGTIHAWLDDGLSPAEAARVEAHVGECADCGALVAEARGLIAGASRILSALDDVPGDVIPALPTTSTATRRARVRWFMRRDLRVAAGLLLFVGTSAVLTRGFGVWSNGDAVDALTASKHETTLPAVAPAQGTASQVAAAPQAKAAAGARDDRGPSADSTSGGTSSTLAKKPLASEFEKQTANLRVNEAISTLSERREDRTRIDSITRAKLLDARGGIVPAAPTQVAQSSATQQGQQRQQGRQVVQGQQVQQSQQAQAQSGLGQVAQSQAAPPARVAAELGRGDGSDRGTIGGVVTEKTNGKPLAGANVMVLGTLLGTVTDSAGRYQITRVPVGVRALQVTRIGFDPANDSIRIVGGVAAKADVAMSVKSLRLDQVVSTGVMDPTSGVKLPITIAALTADEIPIPMAGPTNALAGRIAGATVQPRPTTPQSTASAVADAAKAVAAATRAAQSGITGAAGASGSTAGATNVGDVATTTTAAGAGGGSSAAGGAARAGGGGGGGGGGAGAGGARGGGGRAGGGRGGAGRGAGGGGSGSGAAAAAATAPPGGVFIVAAVAFPVSFIASADVTPERSAAQSGCYRLVRDTSVAGIAGAMLRAFPELIALRTTAVATPAAPPAGRATDLALRATTPTATADRWDRASWAMFARDSVRVSWWSSDGVSVGTMRLAVRDSTLTGAASLTGTAPLPGTLVTWKRTTCPP